MRATSTSDQKPLSRRTRYSLLASPGAVKVSRTSSLLETAIAIAERVETGRAARVPRQGRRRSDAKRARKSSPVASRKKPAPRAVLPMPLQIGDRITNETGGRPYTTAGGKISHARVQRVDQPASVVQRPTPERMSSLTVTRRGAIMPRAARASRLRVAHRGHARRAPDGRVRRLPRPYLDGGLLG